MLDRIRMWKQDKHDNRKQSLSNDLSSVGIAGTLGVQPPLSVFNPLVALVYLSYGSDLTPTDCNNVKKILNFLVNTWVFKAQNAPKPVFGRGSAPDPAGGAYDAPQTP